MTSTSKQIALGEKPPAKKKKEPPVTELVNIDVNTWKIPNEWDLVDEAIKLVNQIGMNLPNTFHIIKNKIENDFLITDGTLLWTNKPCPGCSKKHTSSIDVKTQESIQQCSDSKAIFKDQKNKKFVQVQLICPTCKKNHLTMAYSSWQTLADKRCSDCQQKTAAADAVKRKKESRREEEDETTPQLTPETNSEDIGIDEVAEAIEELEIDPLLKEKYKNMEEWEICQSVKAELESMGMERYYSAFVKKENKIATNINQVMLLAEEYIQKARTKLNEQPEVIEEEIQTSESYFGEFLTLAQDFGPTIKRLVHPLYSHDFYLTTENNLISAMTKIHKKAYWGKNEFTNSRKIFIMNHQSFNIFEVTNQNISTLTESDAPLEFTQLKPEDWLSTLFPEFEYQRSTEKLKKYKLRYSSGDYVIEGVFKEGSQNFKSVNGFVEIIAEDLNIDLNLFESLDRESERFLECAKELIDENKKLAHANKKQDLSPRGDKKDEPSLKADNGTRKGVPFVEKDKKKKKEKQISLQSFTTMRINVNKLKTTDFQFRTKLNDEHIDFLKDSMNQKRDDGSDLGNIEAVLVREIDDGFFEIISGHHRIAAAKKAKQKFLKCEVLNVDDAAAIEVAIIANFSRMELSPVEEARALKAYRDLTELSFERIGKRIGKGKSWVSRRLSLLNTSEDVQKALETGHITPAHVKAVSSLETKVQDKLLKKVVKDGMTTDSLEWEVRNKKREQEKLEKAEEDSKKFAKYIQKNLEELQDKTISKTDTWSSDNRKKIYDMHINDLFSKANLREYRYENAKILKPFYDILKEKDIQLVDGRKLEQKLRDEQIEDESVKKEGAKKKEPCKICDVKLKIDETWFCPIADPSKKHPNCKDFYESDGYGWELPEKLKKLCFICTKEIKKGAIAVSNYQSKGYHSSCYYQLIEQIEGLELKPCATCKKRGDCGIQGTAKDLVQDHGVTLSLKTCGKYSDETIPDQYLVSFNDDFGLELYLTDDLTDELESDLTDIAEYILEKEIPLKQISAAEDAESQAAFEELKLRLLNIKEAKSGIYQYMLSYDKAHWYTLAELETDEGSKCDREDMLNYLANEELPLVKIKAIDEESEKILQELQKGTSDS